MPGDSAASEPPCPPPFSQTPLRPPTIPRRPSPVSPIQRSVSARDKVKEKVYEVGVSVYPFDRVPLSS